MKKYLLSLLLFIPNFAFSSSVYITEGRVETALQAIYSPTAGIGGKSCTLCHSTSAGGDGNINGGFGQDFVDTALDVIGARGGDGLAATGVNSLETIFSDTQFQDEDSDNDGRSNGTEFAEDTDPASDSTDSSSGGGGGGGCGFITTPPSGGSGTGTALLVALLLIPVALITRLRTLRR